MDDCRRRVHALVRGRGTKGRAARRPPHPPQNNSTPTTMDDSGHPTSGPSFSDSEDDEDIEMVGLEGIAMTPQKAAHPIDDDSESSDDEDDAGRGLLVSGSQRRPGHAHTRSLSLSRGIDVWQQVRNIVMEVSVYPPAAG